MYRILTSVFQEHDWRLVALGCAICLLTAIVAINLFLRAVASDRLQTRWLVVAGVVSGAGMWATHFITVLAYRPSAGIASDVAISAFSLVAAASLAVSGFWIALRSRLPYAAAVGGGVVGSGVAAMQGLGIAALAAPTRVIWSFPLALVSVTLAVALGAGALAVARRNGKAAATIATALLSLAILSHHFTAMAAFVLAPEPARAIGFSSLRPALLALCIAAAAIAALGVSLVAALYDRQLSARQAQHERAQSELIRRSQEALRKRNMQLDAALNNMTQALCMFDSDGKLIVCNDNYVRIFDLPPELTRPGTSIEDILRDRVAKGVFPGDDGEAYLRERFKVIADKAPSKTLLEFRDGRIFSVAHQPMADGGYVATHEDVTAQVNAQRELSRVHTTLRDAKAKAEQAASDARSAHQRLLDAANLMQEGFVLFDAEDRHVLWNQRYLEMFGEARDAIVVGARFEDVLRTGLAKGEIVQARGREEEWLAERLSDHRAPESSFEVQLPGDRWFQVNERRLADGGRLGMRVDITDLKHREESMRLLFAGNPLPMWVYDQETLRFLAVNEAAISHYGYRLEQFLAMTIADLRPAEERDELRQIVRSSDGARQNGRQARHLKANGEEIQVAIYSRGLDHEGRAASLVAAVDITQSKRAEAEVLRTREFLDTIIENVPAPIIVRSAIDFRHILINRAAETFLGATRESVIGKTVADICSRETAAIIAELDRILLERRQEMSLDEHTFETLGNGARYVTSKRLPVLDEKGAPLYLVTVLNDVTEWRLANERIAHLASHDALTSLPNRAAFNQKLANALAHADPHGVAMLCVDIDRFKEINDVFGHVAADNVLEILSRRLREAVGETFLARVGGDEFNLIVENGAQPAAAVEIADRLLAAAAVPIKTAEGPVIVGLTIGVAVSPTDGRDTETLTANAEAALSRAKNEGRGLTRFFEADMDKRLRERRAIEYELKSAIELGQFHVQYQPQSSAAGELLGFEALMRWRHPTRGSIPPSVFVPIAEECGAIIEMGEWILRESCRQAAAWPRGLTLAVNLSPVQFRKSDLFATICAALMESGLPGARLELEITEGVLIGDSASALAVLRRIKALGVRIAIDDFGTGYSSLSYLRSFPFDKIKIDRSFVTNVDRDPQSAAIVRAILGLAHGLHLPVTAEGVETEEQLAFLEGEGCDAIQGYLIGRPRPIEDYAAWIAADADAAPRPLKVVA